MSFSDHDRFASNYTFTVGIAQSVPIVVRMVSMTKFDGSRTAEWWLCILEKELPAQLTPTT